MAKRWHAIAAVSKFENVIICYPMTAKNMVRPSGKKGVGGLAFCYTRNAKGLREPEKKGGLTPVELD